MFSDLIMFASGVVLLLFAMLVLHASHAAQISTRTVAAFLIGAAGAWCIAQALGERQIKVGDLLLPLGVAVLLGGALWRRRGQPMRRAEDWDAGEPPPAGPARYPWAGPRR